MFRWSKEGAELSEGGEELQLRGVAADAGTYQVRLNESIHEEKVSCAMTFTKKERQKTLKKK